MKRLLIALFGFLVLAGAAMAGFWLVAKKNLENIHREYASLKAIELTTIQDGIYQGEAGSIPVYVSLAITVKGGKVEDISIKKQRCGEGYQARGVLQRIIAAQKPKVDAVSGATLSSQCIMVAAYRALSNDKPSR